MGISLYWFVGLLVIELWLAPYLLMFGPDIAAAWRGWRMERRMLRYAARYVRENQGRDRQDLEQYRVARYPFVRAS